MPTANTVITSYALARRRHLDDAPPMSFNLPPNCLLKLTKGAWADVKYPARIVAQAKLSPQDYFEPVDPQSPRSCVPAGGRDFSCLFDSNSGRMFTRGPTMFPPVSVTFEINDGA